MTTNPRIPVLKSLLVKWQAAYYNDKPLVEDEVYDAALDELAALEADSPEVKAIGAVPTSAWPKVKHTIPMGSLSKVKTPEAMREWVRKVTRPVPEGHPILEAWYEELVMSDKLDGLSISLEYRDGSLYQALTRGGDDEGEDITRNVIKMAGIPLKLAGVLDLTVRGEIVMHKSMHASKYIGLGYSNTRQAASGISRRTDGKGCQDLTIYCYWADHSTPTVTERFKYLDSLGFLTPRVYVTAMTPGVKTPHDLWLEYQQTTRVSLPYDIDGLVLELNSTEYQESLGVVDGRPRGAIAFKFATINRETVARQRINQVGGRGRVTPVAVFDTVNLLGAEITRASLYNQSYIEAIGFDVGAHILVARANDVIPRVLSVSKSTGTVSQAPTHCPECGTPLVKEGEYLVCPNVAECPAQTEGRLLKWCRELGIMEWGPALLERLVSAKGVESVLDLYHLSVQDLAGLPGMGAKSAETAYQALRAPLPLPLDKYLGALSIPLCGSATIQMLEAAGLDTLPAIRAAKLDTISAVPGLGPKKAKHLRDWLDANQSLLDGMPEAGITLRIRPVSGRFLGQSFCFTGTMTHKRDELASMVETAGGMVKERVGKDLTYLVAARTDSTKALSAAKNGIKVISEAQFLEMLK